MYMSRVQVRTDAPSPMSMPMLSEGAGPRLAESHRLIWSLFGDAEAADFLWRETRVGSYLVLSREPPADTQGLFEVDAKPFRMAFRRGETLQAMLRANATVRSVAARKTVERKSRAKREDISVRALRAFREQHGTPTPEQVEQVVADAARAWLTRKALESGFKVVDGAFAVENSEFMVVPHGAAPMRFRMLDLSLHLEVTDPVLFAETLAKGLGRSKRYGCGLMLVRPAP